MRLHYLIISFLLFCSIVVNAQLKQDEHSTCAYNCVNKHDSSVYLFEGKHTPYQNLSFKSGNMKHFIGSMHQHSGFSDGFPGTRPTTYYNSGKDKGFDFVAGSEHSDNFNFPIGLHEECVSSAFVDCITINPQDIPGSFLKWSSVQQMADEATEADKFLAIRGFEWTSDRFGHINVYFSKNITNAKTDGGYVLLNTFWNWLAAAPIQIPMINDLVGGYGGADALAVFNHPGDKKLSEQDPGYNWNNFEYVEKADSIMAGIEVFNSGKDYAADGRSFYQEALNNGWHVGAIASEDHHEEDWNNARDEKTVFISTDLSLAGMKDAMRNRRFYAVRDHGLRMDYFAGSAIMGSRIQRKTGSLVRLRGNIRSNNVTAIELVSSTDSTVKIFEGSSFEHLLEVTENEQWYYLRAVNSENKTMAYSSPIWISGGGNIVDDIDATGIASTFTKANFSEPFPNPNAGKSVSVYCEEPSNIRLELFNSFGVLVFSRNTVLSKGVNELFNPQTLQIAAGIYSLNISSLEFKQSHKIILAD